MSLFGRREKRLIADLQDDKQRLAAKIAKLEDRLRTEAFNAKYKARQNIVLTDENVRLQNEVVSLGRMLTQETVDAVADVAAAERRAARYRAAWTSARQRAAQQHAQARGLHRALTDSTRAYLHLMDTGEVMRMYVGPSLAQLLTDRLDRALKACARYRRELAAQYRVNDFLGQQLLDSVSGHDPRLKALAGAVKDSEVSS